mgnify:CR=1 FL=1
MFRKIRYIADTLVKNLPYSYPYRGYADFLDGQHLTKYFLGSGVCERTDGFKYEGQWLNNRRHGYGITTFKDGSKEEGKYKHNYFITTKKRNIMIRAGKTKEKIDNSVKSARKASEVSKQKAEISMTRFSPFFNKILRALPVFFLKF